MDDKEVLDYDLIWPLPYPSFLPQVMQGQHMTRPSRLGIPSHMAHVSYVRDRGGLLPYIYIDRIFHELRSELLSAMHSALEAQGRKGQVDVDRLHRAFTRAAVGKCANPQRVSDRCIAETTTKPRKAKDARIDE
jgi:hypothetical protein